MSIKKKIQKSFDNASFSYDTVAFVQKQTAQFLVEKLLQSQFDYPKTILDLGTGTGYIPELLKDIFPEALYTLNDISEQMLTQCRTKMVGLPFFKNFSFQRGDMTSLEFSPHDLIMSNLAFQWIQDREELWKMLRNFFSLSKTFAFSTLIDGTFQEWYDIVHRHEGKLIFPSYPSEEELILYGNQMAQAKKSGVFQFWIQEIHFSFETPLLLMRHLKSLGASVVEKTMSPKSIKRLIREEAQSVQCSYKIFFGLLKG